MASTSPPVQAPTPVALLSGVRLYREGLANAIDGYPDFEVIVAEDPRSVTVWTFRRARPEIIVVEGGSASHALLGELRTYCADAAIVAFAVKEDPDEILACVESGASAFVPVDSTAEELVGVLRSVLRGEFACSARSAQILYKELQRMRCSRRRADAVAELTFREREVFDHLSRGLRNQEIADALSIQLATVKNHVHSILEKLGARSRTEAASYADAQTLHR